MAEAADSLADAPGRSRGADLISGFTNLNLLRQAGLMIGIAASVAIGFAVVLWSQGEDYRPLYGSLDRLDSSEVGEILDFNGIPYKVDVNTGALLVPTEDMHQARLKLAEAGIPGNNSVGFELLDQEQPLGTSQFMETTRYKRGLEGELARTITSINSVRSARVHLAIPKQSVFIRDGREPTASVFLELFPGRGIQSAQIRGIANLVASSIPELKLENVTVVDQKGNLLSAALEEDKKLAQASRQLEYVRDVESDVVLRIRRLLTPIVGADKFTTEVSANLDFTEMEEAGESYAPEASALRSEQVVEEKTLAGTGIGGIPGALTNQPPADGVAPAQVPGAGEQDPETETPSNSRSQATRNYELDRTISYTRHQKGRLRRLTVAVVVDNKMVTDPETGEKVEQPWTDAELERLTILVRDAVGYSADRGDSVNILNAPFIPLEEPAVEKLEWWQTERGQYWAKQAAAVLIIGFLILGLLRPVFKSLARTGSASRWKEDEQELAALRAAGIDSLDALSNETVTLTGGDSLALPSPEESYEKQLNAVKGLVAEDAGRVAQVIKRWINEE